MFRKGLLLKRLSRREEAIEAIILSLRGYLWNWSTWLLLGSCLGDGDEVSPTQSKKWPNENSTRYIIIIMVCF